MEKHWDAIIIGGGPAGSTVARYAAKEGVKVLVIDSRLPRTSKGIKDSQVPDKLSVISSLKSKFSYSISF